MARSQHESFGSRANPAACVRAAVLRQVVIRAAILPTVTTMDDRSDRDLSLGKDAPEPREVGPPTMGEVVELPEVGGLHHRYERLAA
jgi:hypothetical protein